MDLAGANAIVTGAAVGTGRAIAERLAADGADVIVADVDERGGEETVARIEHAGGRARFVPADMLAPADVEALIDGADGLRLTPAGERWFAKLSIDTQALTGQKRAFCRACLDWSERRHHLAGALGAALLARFIDLGWAKRARDSRLVLVTPDGERELRRLFDAREVAPA